MNAFLPLLCSKLLFWDPPSATKVSVAHLDWAQNKYTEKPNLLHINKTYSTIKETHLTD